MAIINRQSGNVFWIILMAVALLAALTIVISRSGSSIDQSGDVEQNRIEGSRIMRYAKSIEAGVQQLMLQQCSENEISFENTTDTNYTNAKSPADKSCHVFDANGAGLEWREFSSSNLSATTSNIAFVDHITIEDLEDNSAPELIFAVRVSQGLCMQINKDLGISTASADITNAEADWNYQYVGSFDSEITLGTTSSESPALHGKYSGCLISDEGEYVYIHVLIAR